MKMMKAANLTEETFVPCSLGELNTARTRARGILHSEHVFSTPRGSLLLVFPWHGASSRDGFRSHPASWLSSLCTGCFSAASWISVSNPALQITWLRSVFVVFLWNCDSQCTPFTQNPLQPRDWKACFQNKVQNRPATRGFHAAAQMVKWVREAFEISIF